MHHSARGTHRPSRPLTWISNPAMNRWAIVKRPSGTNDCGSDRPDRPINPPFLRTAVDQPASIELGRVGDRRLASVTPVDVTNGR